MRGRTVIGFVSVVAVAAAAVALAVLVRGEADRPRSAPVVRIDDSAALQAMQQQMMALRAQVVQQVRAAAEPPAAEPGRAPAPSRDERRRQVLEAQHRTIALLGDRVDDGPRDPAWSSALAAQLTTSLPTGSGSVLRSVTCGASLCRAVLSHPDRQRVDRFIETLSGTLHLTYQLFFERDGDALVTTVFVARDGARLGDLAKQLAAR